MRYDFETMKRLFEDEYNRHLGNMKNELAHKDMRWGFYNKCQGAMELAMLLGLLSDEEMQECYKEAHDVFFESLQPECGKEEDKFPFEEVPEEEQETFENEDLPFPEVVEKSPEEFIEIPEENVLPFPPAEPEAEKIQKLFKEQYDEYIACKQEERGNVSMCRYMYLKCCGLLDFASRLGLIDFAEHMGMCKALDEIRKNGANSFDVVPGCGDYIDADIALAKVEDQYNLMKFNFGQPGCCDGTDLHFMHGYMRCVADIGVMSEDSAEEVIMELAGLYEKNGIKNIEIPVLGIPAVFKEKDAESFMEKVVSSVMEKAVIIRPAMPELHKSKANSEKCE